MGTTCPAPGSPGMSDMAFMPGDVENQIFTGLSGALVVGDDRTLLPEQLRHIAAHTVVLKDVQLDSAGHIPQNTATTSINSNDPTVRLVNGQLRPVLSMRPNETQLWRLVNAGADIFYQLQLDGYHFTVIGEDGTPVAHVTNADTLLLPPGKRYDVLVTANANPGQATLRTTAYGNGPQGDSYPDTALATVKVAGHHERRMPEVTGAMPTAPADLSAVPIAQRRTLDLSENGDGTVFYINGKQFSMDGSVFDTPAKLGTVEEWTIVNHSGEDHPFHLHTNAFQVVSVNGVAQPYTHRQDIVPVPHAVDGVPGQVVIRVAFADYPGKWMFHCHIAAHEDHGMMSFINVVP
ncbi:multicopper oxidase family protein [Kitasatospora sp. NPDC004669]|uniref:multicopper oxidase family protein n=1 Tax=Kitasatospora sp. NPDC004669 TaxID=3154555 RepID=UPI0033BDB860